MSTETKIKLIYCGELALIAVIAIVIGVLKLTGVIDTNPTRLLVYNIITFIGGLWFIIDLVWTLKSPKKRQKSSLLDKFSVIPISAYLLFFDIFCFIYKANDWVIEDMFARISVGVVLLYVGALYIFQAFYHFNHPVPALIEAIEEGKKIDEEENNKNENPDSEITEDDNLENNAGEVHEGNDNSSVGDK